MSLENHVPSLYLCRQWKDIGGRQDTIFSWFEFTGGPWDITYSDQLKEMRIAAPLTSELMGWFKNDLDKTHFNKIGEEWFVYLYGERGICDKSLPNALMKMAIEEEKRKK